jgi:hypothetical protein
MGERTGYRTSTAMQGATGSIMTVLVMMVSLGLSMEYSFDRDCGESAATLTCEYKGPGVLTPDQDHRNIHRLKLEQVIGLSVVMTTFADHVAVEYLRSIFHEDLYICDQLHIAPRQLITVTDQYGTVTSCVSTFFFFFFCLVGC